MEFAATIGQASPAWEEQPSSRSANGIRGYKQAFSGSLPAQCGRSNQVIYHEVNQI